MSSPGGTGPGFRVEGGLSLGLRIEGVEAKRWKRPPGL